MHTAVSIIKAKVTAVQGKCAFSQYHEVSALFVFSFSLRAANNRGFDRPTSPMQYPPIQSQRYKPAVST